MRSTNSFLIVFSLPNQEEGLKVLESLKEGGCGFVTMLTIGVLRPDGVVDYSCSDCHKDENDPDEIDPLTMFHIEVWDRKLLDVSWIVRHHRNTPWTPDQLLELFSLPGCRVVLEKTGRFIKFQGTSVAYRMHKSLASLSFSVELLPTRRPPIAPKELHSVIFQLALHSTCSLSALDRLRPFSDLTEFTPGHFTLQVTDAVAARLEGEDIAELKLCFSSLSLDGRVLIGSELKIFNELLLTLVGWSLGPSISTLIPIQTENDLHNQLHNATKPVSSINCKSYSTFLRLLFSSGPDVLDGILVSSKQREKTYGRRPQPFLL
jgi:hypothetical protein